MMQQNNLNFCKFVNICVSYGIDINYFLTNICYVNNLSDFSKN